MKNFAYNNFKLFDFSFDPAITLDVHSMNFDELAQLVPIREFEEENGYKYQGIALAPSIYYMDSGEILILDEKIDNEYIRDFVSPLNIIPFCIFFDSPYDDEPHSLDLDYDEEITYFDEYGNEVVFNEGLTPISSTSQDSFLPDMPSNLFEEDIDRKLAEYLVD